MPVPVQVPPIGVPESVIVAASIHTAKLTPASTMGSEFTVAISVSVVKQLPVPYV